MHFVMTIVRAIIIIYLYMFDITNITLENNFIINDSENKNDMCELYVACCISFVHLTSFVCVCVFAFC